MSENSWNWDKPDARNYYKYKRRTLKLRPFNIQLYLW